MDILGVTTTVATPFVMPSVTPSGDPNGSGQIGIAEIGIWL